MVQTNNNKIGEKMDFLNEAFRSLQSLNEETFDLSVSEQPEELKDFLDDDEEIDVLTIIDDEAENEDDLEDSYMGKVILDCNVCHSLIYKDPSEIVINENGDICNEDEECPFCYSVGDGYKVIGQVKPFEKEEAEAEEEKIEDEIEETEDEIEVEDSDEDFEFEEDKEEIEESLSKNKRSSFKKKYLNEFFDVKGNTVGVGLPGGTGIGGGIAGSLIPGLGESIGEDVSEYQKWVDYDMKKYGKISDETNDKIKKAGLEIIKDDHGDYEVIAKRTEDESLEEDFNSVDIETDDIKMHMDSDDEGKVTVTTEPVVEEEIPADIPEDETIGEVDLDTELEIEDNTPAENLPDEQVEAEEDETEEESDEDEFDEFDEESFEDLGESYLKKVYSNVDSFKVSNVFDQCGKLFVEGLIKFNSGKSKKTNFIFENKNILKSGKIVFEGYNKQITGANKSFRLAGKIDNHKLLSESLNYNYSQNKQKIRGRVHK